MSTNFTRSVRAVAGAADGTGVVDWDGVREAAKGATDPGEFDLSEEERAGFADDVRAAREGLRETSGVSFPLPDRIEVQNRHHWVDANVDTFSRLMAPLEDADGGLFPGVARSVNTGTMAVTLAFLARNVLGQYDPLLMADGDGDHGLYFVRPNVRRVADELDVAYPRFRRWIAFHEVAHAAEFGAAPWLSTYLEDRMQTVVDSLADGRFDRSQVTEMNTAMTAVEGYAELLMDRAFDEEYGDLRRKLDARRQGGDDPITGLLKRVLGLGMKREQYERGAEFFAAVADQTDVATASLVWDRAENLPTESELDDPDQWVRRVV